MEKSVNQVTKDEFYNSFQLLHGVTTAAELDGRWVVKLHGREIAWAKDRPGVGDENYYVTEYFIIK